MRFTVRPGNDPIAGADAALLAAMGLPGGGVIRIGTTHAVVRPAEVSEPTALLLGAEAITNAGVSVGTTVEAKRTLLSAAATVTLAGDNLPLDARTLVHALQGR